MTKAVTPAIVALLTWLHPVLSRGADTVQKRTSVNKHTGIFEREDLIKLIEEQQWQQDNRIPDEELEIVKRALRFDDHTVGDILTPRKKVKTVLAGDTVGPILIDEVHKSGQDYVLVRDKKGGMVIGTLQFKRLGLESKGHVRDLMDGKVYYIHEEDSLSEALHAFFTTNHPLFIVVNSFEEYVGIISIENVLQHLLGHIPGSEFTHYADVSAVAARHAHKPEPVDEDEPSPEEGEPLEDETPVKTDEEVVE